MFSIIQSLWKVHDSVPYIHAHQQSTTLSLRKFQIQYRTQWQKKGFCMRVHVQGAFKWKLGFHCDPWCWQLPCFPPHAQWKIFDSKYDFRHIWGERKNKQTNEHSNWIEKKKLPKRKHTYTHSHTNMHRHISCVYLSQIMRKWSKNYNEAIKGKYMCIVLGLSAENEMCC